MWVSAFWPLPRDSGAKPVVYMMMLVILLFAGCSTAPAIYDVETVAENTQIVYGTVDVYGAKGKRQKWGMGWTGHNYFYLTILPAESSEAMTYKLDKDGRFYWALEPGDYKLLGYHWERKGGVSTGHLGADFSVPGSGDDTYLGALELRSFRVGLAPSVEDRFDQAARHYDTKYPQRKGTSVKRLIEIGKALGSVGSYLHQCHADWGIECTDRFKGITPVSPECKSSGFPVTSSLQPTFSWQSSSRGDVTYDLVLYEAAVYRVGGQLVNSYMRGHEAAYVEGIRESSWTPATPLKPDTRYFWSVRLRDGDTVSGWSTQSHFTFMIVAWSSGYGQWFQFRTG